MARAGIGYQTAYYWTCPERDCGAAWWVRHRPRQGATLTCRPGAEQHQHLAEPGIITAWCGAVHVSSGQRQGHHIPT